MAKRKLSVFRKAVQIAFGIAQNAHLSGFVSGQIYSGTLKRFCVPGLNCYSCPGAIGACPIGAIQAVTGARRPKFAFYALGFLASIGILVGRFVCGWLCLFGLFQELLYRIPTRKFTVPPRLDRPLRYLKYGILFIVVLLLPVILRDEFGLSVPYFCKWLCPAGMLEGGIPLLILNKAMRPAAHFLYAWKMVILLAVVTASIFIHRPFCRYMCPLGAFYGLFQKISFLQLTVKADKCTSCGACAHVCPMAVDPHKMPSSAECIRCGACTEICPENALRFTWSGRIELPEPAAQKAEK